MHSTVQFGDNIEDEWFIVYLVLEITSLYDDIVCQVNDSDGEFLLIEAADFLPNWINPDNAENRVSFMLYLSKYVKYIVILWILCIFSFFKL